MNDISKEIQEVKKKLQELKKQEKIIKNLTKKNKKEIVYAMYLYSVALLNRDNESKIKEITKEIKKTKAYKIRHDMLEKIIRSDIDMFQTLSKLANVSSFILAIKDLQEKDKKQKEKPS